MEIQEILLLAGRVVHLHAIKRLIIEQHVVILCPLVNSHVHGLTLVAFYRRQQSTITAYRKSVVEEATHHIFRYHMHKQHHLVLIVRVEEFLRYQRVQLHKVHTPVAFAKRKGVGELSLRLTLRIVNLNGYSGIETIIVRRVVHRIGPHITIRTIQRTKCLRRGEHLIGLFHSGLLASTMLKH